MATALVAGSHAEVQYDISASARTLAYGGSLTSGSLLTAIVAIYTTGVTVTVSDPVNGIYTGITPIVDSDTNIILSFWYVTNTATSAPTVTVTPSGSAYLSIVVDEWTGIQSTSPLRDRGRTSSASSTIVTAFPSAIAGDLLVVGLNIGALATISSVDAPFTIGTNLSSGATAEGIGTAYHLVAAGDEACTFHMSASTKGPSVIAAFIPSGVSTLVARHAGSSRPFPFKPGAARSS